ncbi:MAG: RHS repeat domain-containing protein [Anaerolineae bacterium]
MTGRTVGGVAYTLIYDAENRLTAMSGGVTASYVYDADGNRVKETISGTCILSWNSWNSWQKTPLGPAGSVLPYRSA